MLMGDHLRPHQLSTLRRNAISKKMVVESGICEHRDRLWNTSGVRREVSTESVVASPSSGDLKGRGSGRLNRVLFGGMLIMSISRPKGTGTWTHSVETGKRQ